jgi:hypothetical protein
MNSLLHFGNSAFKKLQGMVRINFAFIWVFREENLEMQA